MPDTPSIGELCWHARNACLKAGLTPVQWRWSRVAWQLFEVEMHQWMQINCVIHDKPPDLPPGCWGIYEGLPIYLTHGLPHAAVACLGAHLPQPPF